MKKIIVCFLIFISIKSFGQDVPFVDGKVMYSIDLPFSNIDRGELFEKSMDFVNDVLVKHNFIVKTSNHDLGEIMTSGITALRDRDKKGFMWDIGEANRLRFDYNIKVYDGLAKVTISNIRIVKLEVNKELVKPFEEDIMEEKRVIQSARDGSFKKKRERRYNLIAENVNNTFYSMIGLYKRYIEK